jgi:hypothetical protein
MSERLAKLASWWWSLTPKERENIRKQFMEKFHTDPVFNSQVRKLLWKQQDEQN